MEDSLWVALSNHKNSLNSVKKDDDNDDSFGDECNGCYVKIIIESTDASKTIGEIGDESCLNR